MAGISENLKLLLLFRLRWITLFTFQILKALQKYKFEFKYLIKGMVHIKQTDLARWSGSPR